jgi:methylenetetrahydrofolate--tRNA-(uracil-5-)-methyltransferase
VDRERFSAAVTTALEAEPGIEIRRRELESIPEDEDVVVATGPLTSPAMTERLRQLLGAEHLYFYDAIAPIVDAETLDHEKLFRASRWDKGGGDDYLNAPLDRDQYLAFREALVAAEVLAAHPCERGLFFEGCLPVEELARRGEDTLRYGPMKPVGLRRPDGSRPYAVVQLRQEDLARSCYNLVGFQSRLRWSEQTRVLRTIPGLEHASFVRLGQVHRNTFVNSPLHLDRWYRVRSAPRLRLAGQLTGVEGYLESAATGLACALYLCLERRAGQPPEPLPDTTALGALARHLVESDPARFQPANIHYGLLLELDRPVPRREKRAALAARAAAALRVWIDRHDALDAAPAPGLLAGGASALAG